MTEHAGEDYFERPELLDELAPEELRRLVGRFAIEKRKDQARIELLEGSVARLSTDELFDTLMSPQGVNERIVLDEAFQEELRLETFAIIGVDVRGVKALNEHSFSHGNELLTLLVERGLPTSIRKQDIICRRGDDFFILARRVNKDGTAEIVDRLQAAYSVEQGIKDTTEGLIPVIASVSAVHASEISGPKQTVTDLLNWKNQLENVATVRNVPPKKAQYAQMWTMLQGSPSNQPGDERYIATLFFEQFFPDFIAQIEASMAERLVVR
jgi:GGDEF domain-containing protein